MMPKYFTLKNSVTTLILYTSLPTSHAEKGTFPSPIIPDPEDFTSSAGAYFSIGPSFRSSNNLKTMLWMVCQRNESCKNSMDKDEFLELLQDHGCNCFPSNAAKSAATDANKIWYHHKNNGMFVDELDYECQQVAQAYTCMDLDNQDGILEQVGKHGCYHGMVFDYHFDNKNLICGPRHNPDYDNPERYRRQDCKKTACEIERNFAIRAMEIMNYDPKGFMQKNSHMKGHCPKNSISGKGVSVATTARPEETENAASGTTMVSTTKKPPMKDSCCGVYPNRLPFNSLAKQCCENGNVSGLGMCGE